MTSTESSVPERTSPDPAAVSKFRTQATVERADNAILRDDPEGKAAFLSTFTPREEKTIMRKVDRRFFVLIGLMYMIKQVGD